MALFASTNGIDAARSRLGALQTLRARAHEQDAADTERLEALRAAQGEVELNEMLGTSDADAPKLRAQIAELEQSIARRQMALPQLLERIRGAIRDLGKARASVPRKAAAKLREKLEQHQAKAAELQQALEQHAGAPFVMRAYHPMPAGVPYTAADQKPVTSHAHIMASEIAAIESEAARIEERAKDSREGGQVSGESLKELLGICGNVEVLAPTASEIEDWHRQAVARSAVDWRRRMQEYPQGEPARRTIYSLAFDADGRIIEGKSSVTNSIVSPAETGQLDRQHQGWVRGHQLSDGVGAGRWREG